VARINREIAQLDEDGTLSTDDAGRKDKKRLRTERFNDQAREKAASNPIVVDAANRCCTVPKGAAVERGSDGELACYHCRINQAQQKQKLSNMIHAGGQNTFEKIEEQDKLAQLEKAAEAEAKAARAVAAKEKKEKVAEEKAAFEAALKACVLEMKACLRLRGARNRDEKIRRLTAVLADAAGAAKDVPGAHSQQKKELAKAKEELAKLEKEVADEAKAEAAAEAKDAKAERDAARLAKLQAAQAARASAAAKWTKRLLAVAKKGDAAAAAEVARIQKAMLAAAKAEAEQAALEAAA
jgi:colicin import membrane protein